MEKKKGNLYEILTAKTTLALEKEVNVMLKEGWSLHGPPFAYVRDDYTIIAQAIKWIEDDYI